MHTTIDPQEIEKFAQYANQWWNPNGSFKTLHDINPVRLDFIEKHQMLAGMRVLDIGCGGGILAEAMASKGANVTGLDVEEAAITIAKQHAEQHRSTVNYICQPLEHYQAEKFSVITCMEMLEHVAQPELIIEHAVRLLMPNGYLFLSTIHRTWYAYATVVIAAEYLLELLPRQTHDFAKFIKPSELASIARTYGLEVVSLRGMAYNPFSRQAALQPSVKGNYLMACRLSA